MTVEEAVAELDAISGGDPESAHIDADNIIAQFAPKEVLDAVARLRQRCGGFWYA